MASHRNAYDLLRLILAAMVLVSHSYLLGGFSKEPLELFSKGQITMGDTGVMGFFALSGYLISASYNRSPHILKFIKNRALRIFPGFWVCLIVVGFVIAPSIYYLSEHSLSGFSFFGENSAFSYFYNNMFLSVKQWSIHHVLTSTAYKGSLNGSTWSLLPEVQCYIMVLVLGLLGLLENNKWLLTLFFCFVYTIYAVKLMLPVSYGPTILTLTNALPVYTTFLCGMMLYAYSSKISIDSKGYIFLALFSIILLRLGGFMLIAPIVIAIFCVKLFATFSFTLKNDISYGLYIYAFPVQHLIYVSSGHKLGLLPYIALCLISTSAIAYLSFILVERPFLRLKR